MVVEIERIHVVVRLCEDTTTATNPDATARYPTFFHPTLFIFIITICRNNPTLFIQHYPTLFIFVVTICQKHCRFTVDCCWISVLT